MSESVLELEERAKRLSPEDRARLALLLIESLEADEGSNVEQAWLAEAQRRVAELDRGDLEAIPAADAFRIVRSTLK